MMAQKFSLKYAVFLLIVSLTISCKHQTVSIRKDLIHKLATYKSTSPSPEIALKLFLKSSGGELCMMNIVQLLSLYHKHYIKQYPNLEEFIGKTLNQEIALDTAGFPKYQLSAIFQPDEEVSANFRKHTFPEFRKQYCSPLEAKSLRVENRELTENQINTVLYYFFISNYYVVLDDYSGYYVVGIYDKRPVTHLSND